MKHDNTYKIIEKILSIRKDLSLEDVESLIRERKEKFCGFLSDEGACRLIAQDLLVDLDDRKELRDAVQIRNLVPGLNDVTVAGRIIVVWPPHSFERKDGSIGLMFKLLLADKTGTVQCVIWDPSDQMIKDLGKIHGKGLKIFHGYTKPGLFENVELHTGRKTSILIDSIAINKDDLPELKDFFTDLSDIKEGEKVNIQAIIKEHGRLISFERFDRKGRVLRMKIGDQAGEAVLLAWDEQCEKISNIPRGSMIRAMNCKVKIGSNGEREVHVGKNSVVYLMKDKNEPFQLGGF